MIRQFLLWCAQGRSDDSMFIWACSVQLIRRSVNPKCRIVFCNRFTDLFYMLTHTVLLKKRAFLWRATSKAMIYFIQPAGWTKEIQQVLHKLHGWMSLLLKLLYSDSWGHHLIGCRCCSLTIPARILQSFIGRMLGGVLLLGPPFCQIY